MTAAAFCLVQLASRNVALSVSISSTVFFSSSFTQNKTNQIVPEITVELRGATIGWASKDKSSKKNVLEVCVFVCV